MYFPFHRGEKVVTRDVPCWLKKVLKLHLSSLGTTEQMSLAMQLPK